MEKEAKEKLLQCSSWIGSLLVGVGTVMAAAGAIVLVVGAVGVIVGASVVSAGVAVGAAAVAAVGAVVIGGGMMINDKVKKANATEAARLKSKANKSQQLMTKMEKITQGFKDMAQDSGRMDKLFMDFMNEMQNPKKKSASIDKMQQRRKINLVLLQSNVKSIIGSFAALQKYSIEILDTIDKAQDRFNSN